MTKEQFIEECAFAKVVNTHYGAALLIAGVVLEVKGPYNAFEDKDHQPFAVEWLAEALRRGGHEHMKHRSQSELVKGINAYAAGQVNYRV